MRGFRGRMALLRGVLIATTAVGTLGGVGYHQIEAWAQEARVVSYDIPAQSLTTALTAFARASGLRLAYPAALTEGRATAGVSGTLSSAEALAGLLAGTGLTYAIDGDVVTIADPARAPVAYDGSIMLDTIDVVAWVENAGVGWDGSAESVYTTPGAVSHISAETIAQYRGTTPSDVLRGVPGVLSGASRSSGSVDVNIQGLQGMGRVAVTVDGASNAVTLYHGYQGVSNRSYIDPDFIGSVAIERGPSTGAGGAGAIGGAVSMRTISADDIIPDGATHAIRIKAEVGTNTSTPLPVGTTTIARAVQGYLLTTTNTGVGSPPVRDIGRPGFLLPTGGAGSVVYAGRSENAEIVLGAARRLYGDYHVGSNGDGVPQLSDICSTTTNTTLRNQCNRGSVAYELGLTTYLPGEQVMNTSQDIFSTLAKVTLRNEDHTLELIQTHYDTIFGETYPFGFVVSGQTTDQNPYSQAVLDTYATRYRWNPDNDLVDVRFNAALTHSHVEAPDGVGGTSLTDVVTDMITTDLSNTSRFATDIGDLTFNYGTALQLESTGPGERPGSVRDGDRSEASVFANSTLSVLDLLQLNGGLRYHHVRVTDNSNRTHTSIANEGIGEWDYSAGASLTALDWFQPFVNYRNAARMPSLWESVSTGFVTIDPNLRAERTSTWQVGANVSYDGVLHDDDQVRLKLAYFNNTVDDYIYRMQHSFSGTNLYITNLPRVNFSGLELSGRYEVGTFSADISGIYYTNVEFCRTLDTCQNSTLAGDYATNYVPPEFSASLTIGNRFLDDRLLLSGRATYHGLRAADAEEALWGANPLIGMIPWNPVLIFDLYGEYDLTENAKLTFSVENLTDLYYVDPLSLMLVPSPGRTLRVGFTGTISDAPGGGAWFGEGPADDARFDWSGFYVGASAGAATANTRTMDYARTTTTYSTGRVSTSSLAYFEDGSASNWLAGIRLGYDHQFDNDLVVGFGLEAGWTDVETGTGTRTTSTQVNTPKMSTTYGAFASASLRAGIGMGNFLVYGRGGIAAAQMDSHANLGIYAGEASGIGLGFSAGAGVEYAITENVSVFGEYQHMRLVGPEVSGSFSTSTAGYDYSYTSESSVNLIQAGLNFRF
jgi:hemoglobin/transferrin/lactoferrin receptor protein